MRIIRTVFNFFHIFTISLIIFITTQIISSKENQLDLSQLPHISYFHKLLKNPKILAFLDTISYAEGTFLEEPSDESYRIQYSYKRINDLYKHPEEVICQPYKGKMICSTAAGRYQFLKKTWNEIAPHIGAKNFSPLNQDLAALVLLYTHDAIEPLLNNNIEQSIYNVRKVWASLPGAPYDQPTRSLEELQNFYKKNLKNRKKIMKKKSFKQHNSSITFFKRRMI